MKHPLVGTARVLTGMALVLLGLNTYGCGDSATENPEATLTNMSVSIGTNPATLQPAFNPATTNYTVDLSNNVTTVTVGAQPAVAGDNVTIDGQTTTSRVIDLGQPVPAGSTTLVSITVSDPPNTAKTYAVLLRRAPLEGNNSLQSLTVVPGALVPTFNANTQTYTVDVANAVGSVTITPTLQDTAATMAVNGESTTSGQARTIPLGPAGQPKNIPIVVTAQNGNQKTYTVTVSRGIASNNNLSALIVSPGTLNPAFSATTTGYRVDVLSGVSNITVTPTRQDPNATITVNGAPASSGQPQTILLNGPGSATGINIVVTAQNGSQKLYAITAQRAALGGNNNLSTLTLSPGALNPAFNANVLNYTVDVASNITSVAVTPARQDSNAAITVNGQAAPSGQPRTILLNVAGSPTLINIVVTAQNGSQKPYTITVQRAALGGNNNLSALAVTPSPLDSPFNANDLSYTVNVGSSVGSVTVRPTLADPAATMTVNGQPTNSGQTRTVTLNGPGQPSIIPIVVTAQNGSQKPYTVTVQRAALGGNNNLSALSVSPGTLNPVFNTNTVSYTAEVGSNVTSVTVTPRMQDSAATMTVNGQPTPSGQARSIPLNGAGSNTLINILVAAQNGSQKNYTVNVSRAALGGNNNLSGLSVSSGTLNPTFRADRIAYTVNVGSAVASLNVTATVQDAGASLTMNGQGASSGQSRSIPLGSPGTTTEINVVVNAPNGNPRTYQIDVIREALGGNNNLQNLSVAPGSLTPVFAPDTLAYSMDVTSDISSINVAATKADSNAVISGDLPNSGQATVQLDGPGTSKVVSIIVTAANGVSKTYAITVNRAAAAAKPSTPTVGPDLIAEDDSCLLVGNLCFPPTSNVDNITNVKRPRFRIPPPATGETPSLYIDTNKDTSASFDAGTNTLRPSADLSDNDHSITYTLTNAGGESDESPALTVTINTTAPVQ